MKKSTVNISTLAAVGGSLVALPAAALELGDVKIDSSLGQPLRASIAYALAPNETIANSCVSVQGAGMRGVIPGAGSATVSVANGIISVVGKSAVREPLITMRLNVHCPYAGRISRDYTMFIDPVRIAEQASVESNTSAAPVTAAAAPAARRNTTPAARRVVRDEPVVSGTRYQVAQGETLGDIAERIVDRPVALWPAVQRIFAANPDAFLDNDVNKLKAGSWLTIPDFDATAPLAVAPATSPVDDFAAEQGSDVSEGSLYTGLTEAQSTLPAEITEPASDFAKIPDPVTVTDSAEAAEETTPRVIDIPDTELAAPEITAESPNVATARVSRPTRVEAAQTNWLLWLGGAGIGLIALLLFFGRMVRNRFGSSPIGTIEPQERRKPESSRMLEVVSEMEVKVEEEVTIDELDETQENLALDADLIIGSGLTESDEVDVAQDFGFAATTKIDHELTAEMSETNDVDNRKGETDIIPPLNIEPQSILESEVLPDDDDDEGDDYDMSVIVDATKMPNPEDATQRDLEAVPVETDNDTLVSGDYTVSSEVDYTVLEQDYEDELTATQALNEEIARAAEELADSMDTEGDISMASVAALDVTAQIPAHNDDEFASDVDDTNVNPELDDQVEDDDVTAKFRSQEGKSA